MRQALAAGSPAQELARRLRATLGDTAVLDKPQQLAVYECDGYVVEKKAPDLVVFPRSTEDVAAVVALCNELGVPFLGRGAGTSLAGGCLPVGGGAVISLARMNRILEVSLLDRYAVVQPGVVNLELSRHLAGSGYHYAPDPSSQAACTIGGNVATNSGGPHTLKYGVTSNHVLGVEVVLPDASVVRLGGPLAGAPGLDLTGLFVGSEGTLGICTEVTVRLTRDPESRRTLLAVFETVDDATHAISSIVGAGIVPAALEMMDQGIVAALEEAFHMGFPLDAGALLLIEVDGLEVALEGEARQIEDYCRAHAAREVRIAADEAQRRRLWKCRKQAFGAVGRLSPSYCTQDGVVPRTKLPEILEFIRECAARNDIGVVNVFHAGDGNIHPLLLFDERDREQVGRAIRAGDEILARCLELGGSVTGEHGIGVEKTSFLDKMFTPSALEVMGDVRRALNPDGRCSPGKLFPVAGACGAEHVERSRPGRQAPV